MNDTPAKTPRRKPNDVFYVLSERSRLFAWNPIEVFPTRALAEFYRDLYEQDSPYGSAGYKVTTVKMTRGKPKV